jgi:hypothetical protein
VLGYIGGSRQEYADDYPEGRPREDIGSVAQKSTKSYIDEKYGVEEAEAKYAEWDKATV